MSNPRPIILKGRKKLLEPVVTLLMGIHQLLETKDIGTVYGSPSQIWQSERKFKPQVLLYFKESSLNLAKGEDPVDGRISFRIMNETSNTISSGEMTLIATKIRDLFMVDGGYKWSKGKKMCSYTDWDKGYQFQLLCRTEGEGRQLVTKILSIQGHVPEWKRFSAAENDAPDLAYPEDPGTQIIVGETEKIPIARPNADVRFQYAVIHLHGRKKPIALCDRSRKLLNPLVS